MAINSPNNVTAFRYNNPGATSVSRITQLKKSRTKSSKYLTTFTKGPSSSVIVMATFVTKPEVYTAPLRTTPNKVLSTHSTIPAKEPKKYNTKAKAATSCSRAKLPTIEHTRSGFFGAGNFEGLIRLSTLSLI